MLSGQNSNHLLETTINSLAHQNRTIAIASDFRVDGAKSPEILQKKGVLGPEIAARNRRSLGTFHRTLKSQCSIAVSSLGNRAISGVRDGHRNRTSQKSLRFRCAKINRPLVFLQMRLSLGNHLFRCPSLRCPYAFAPETGVKVHLPHVILLLERAKARG